MPYPASVIAYAFVRKGIEEGKLITQMKVQKMVFFAHGFHLAKYGESLIEECFEAWKFGPVIPSIYQDFKYFGSKPITETDLLLFFPNTLANHKLDAKAKDAVDYAWKATKDVDAIALSNWTHQPNSPWTEVYRPNQWSTPISNSAIKIFFESLLTLN